MRIGTHNMCDLFMNMHFNRCMHTDGYTTKQVIQPLYCFLLDIYIYICIHTLLYLYGKSVKNITIEIKL